jgi:hypothetical protein
MLLADAVPKQETSGKTSPRNERDVFEDYRETREQACAHGAMLTVRG